MSNENKAQEWVDEAMAFHDEAVRESYNAGQDHASDDRMRRKGGAVHEHDAKAETEKLRAHLTQRAAVMDALLGACRNALDIISTDRQGFVDCHTVRGPRLDDPIAHGLVWVAEDVWIESDVAEALRDYDRAIAQLDDALALAKGPQP